ncbi:MAG: hypothetical protein HQL54_08415 [Magnetococcales bacterium]|nr:hypothetical protein [Magnetococcales bacterium]
MMQNHHHSQSGVVLITVTAVLVMVGAGMMLERFSQSPLHVYQKVKQAHKLMEARQSLIAFSILSCLDGVQQRGGLPCPDQNGDGLPDGHKGVCLGADSTEAVDGALPWRTLQLNGRHMQPLHYTLHAEGTSQSVATITWPGDPSGAGERFSYRKSSTITLNHLIAAGKTVNQSKTGQQNGSGCQFVAGVENGL